MAVFFQKRGNPPVVGRIASDYEIGEIVKLIDNNTEVDFIVAHHGIPSESYDTSCNGTWLVEKDMLETRRFNSLQSTVFTSSEILSALNVVVFERMGESTKRAILNVKVPYKNATNGIIYTGENGAECNFFLLTAAEVGLTSSDVSYLPNVGAKLDYFLQGTSTVAKERRSSVFNANKYPYWTRDPQSTGFEVSIVADGSAGYTDATSQLGVRRVAIIKNTTMFDPNTNVIL